jgi:hypothetical protein
MTIRSKDEVILFNLKIRSKDEIILFKLKKNRCPYCNYLLDHPAKQMSFDASCYPCGLYFQFGKMRDENGDVDVVEMWKSDKPPHDIENDFFDVEYTEEQKKLAKELKENRKPAIIPDEKFHEWFVNMRQPKQTS